MVLFVHIGNDALPYPVDRHQATRVDIARGVAIVGSQGRRKNMNESSRIVPNAGRGLHWSIYESDDTESCLD